jgi:hypothetical protein
MTQTRTHIIALVFGLAVFSLSPICASAQVTESDVFSAESAILSAGSRAAEISQLGQIPSVGVVNLAIRSTPRRNHNIPDVQAFRISAERNFAGIHRLRAALAANPATRAALADHGVRVSHVVGVDISSNGSMRIYILR